MTVTTMLDEYVEIYEQAKAKLRPAADGSYDERELIDEMSKFVDVDVEKERKRKAKEILVSLGNPNAALADGQLLLPGFEAYGWEPKRVLRHAGHVIANEDALPEFKQEKARRSRKNLAAVSKWANRDTEEAFIHSEWALAEMGRGWPKEELTWGACVKQKGLWSAEEAPVEEEGEGAEE